MGLFTFSLLVFASIFIASGFLHFAHPAPYLRIVPPMLPKPKLLLEVSGGAEILGGIGLLFRKFRRIAAYGLVVLLVAVFPANVYMAVAHIPFPGLLGKSWVQWLRLPLQIPLILWALGYAKASKSDRRVN